MKMGADTTHIRMGHTGNSSSYVRRDICTRLTFRSRGPNDEKQNEQLDLAYGLFAVSSSKNVEN